MVRSNVGSWKVSLMWVTVVYRCKILLTSCTVIGFVPNEMVITGTVVVRMPLCGTLCKSQSIMSAAMGNDYDTSNISTYEE